MVIAGFGGSVEQGKGRCVTAGREEQAHHPQRQRAVVRLEVEHARSSEKKGDQGLDGFKDAYLLRKPRGPMGDTDAINQEQKTAGREQACRADGRVIRARVWRAGINENQRPDCQVGRSGYQRPDAQLVVALGRVLREEGHEQESGDEGNQLVRGDGQGQGRRGRGPLATQKTGARSRLQASAEAAITNAARMAAVAGGGNTLKFKVSSQSMGARIRADVPA